MKPTTPAILLLSVSALPAALLSAGPGQSQISGRTDDRAQPGTLPLEEIVAALKAPGAHEPFAPEPPLGVLSDLAERVPADNALTPAKVELGRQLYFDKRLSRDGTISCATCHDPAKGWTDNLPVSTGIDGQHGTRSAPTVMNRVLGKTQFWDGRAASLEEQAVGPIANPVEMGFTVDEAARVLSGIEGYAVQFEAVFGGGPTPDRIGKALAAFERTILVGANKNDFYEQALPWFDFDPEGEDRETVAEWNRVLDLEAAHRMSPSAERGREVFFNQGRCAVCHVGEDLTDELFHNLGVGIDAKAPDLGRFAQTGDEKDKGAFKTPSLRNVALTAPYMHDGSLATLMDVVEHYAKGGTPNPWLSEKMLKLDLTEQQKQDLVRFLEEALTGPVTEVEVPRLP